jgi:hypothetical protein
VLEGPEQGPVNVGTKQGLLGPHPAAILVLQSGLCPQVEAEHVWGQAMADIMANGMAPQTATDKAFRRLDAMFADYLIHQA